MTSVCLYFQVHQPQRLRRYSFFDVGQVHDYEDDAENRRILERVALKCYLPANELLLRLIDELEGRFRFAFSLSGVVIDLLERHRPDVLESFQRLAATRCVEFLNETNSHSLAFLFSRREFQEQVRLHRKRILALFGQNGRTFRHTELIYNDALAKVVEKMGYRTILAEGTEKLLGPLSPDLVYRPSGCAKVKLLLRNYRLSEDVALRYSDGKWPEYPLTAAKYAHWLHQIRTEKSVINLFMDYETLGERQLPETGIFSFFRALPGEILRNPDYCFQTPDEAATTHEAAGEIASPGLVSWADEERNTTAWLGNAMQQDAVRALYAMEPAIRQCKDAALLRKWRMLQTSDHLYYLCTKWFAEGQVHRYFNPFESPYEAYINYMNILDDLSQSIKKTKGEGAWQKRTVTTSSR